VRGHAARRPGGGIDGRIDSVGEVSLHIRAAELAADHTGLAPG